MPSTACVFGGLPEVGTLGPSTSLDPISLHVYYVLQAYTVEQAPMPVAEKRPEMFYLRPLNLTCGSTFPVAHACALKMCNRKLRLALHHRTHVHNYIIIYMYIKCTVAARLGGLAHSRQIIGDGALGLGVCFLQLT